MAILGSTGSIGVSALDVVARFPARFTVVGLAAGRNVERLAAQVNRFRPAIVSVADGADVERLSQLTRGVAPRIVAGDEGPMEIVRRREVDFVLTAMVGAVGLRPTLAAIERGVDVGIANKEPLVAAGELCTRAALAAGARLLPVDSEHSALHQCLAGIPRAALARLILTCSGGPLRTTHDLSQVTRDQALAHPTWAMGPKITVDSATLMNKGLELVEARWLFDVPAERIDVVIHPQSLVHSLVELVDGSLLAQLGDADMRVPIAYALGYPERLPLAGERSPLQLAGRELTFEEPDHERFPALRLARRALALGGTAPAVLNAANEVAVAAFLGGRLPFGEIVPICRAVLADHPVRPADDLDTILAADSWGRRRAERALPDAPDAGGPNSLDRRG